LHCAAAVVKASLGVVALSLAMAAAGQPAGTQSALVSHSGPSATAQPAVILLKHQPDLPSASTCGGSAFDVNTFINVDANASADVKVTAPGVGVIEEFTDQTGANIGPYDAKFPNFQIRAFGGGLVPNTPITITIATYTGANLTGNISYVSSLTFNCTSGAVLAQSKSVKSIPTLSSFALAATAGVLSLLGAVALRRRRFAPVNRRRDQT